jgi:thioredoxin 1
MWPAIIVLCSLTALLAYSLRTRPVPHLTIPQGPSPDVIEVTLTTFEDVVLKAPRPVLLDCYATWCGPCQQLAPVIEQLAHQQRGRFTFGRLDIDAQDALSGQFMITVVPTLLIFRQGQVVDRIEGAAPAATILSALNRAAALPPTGGAPTNVSGGPR